MPRKFVCRDLRPQETNFRSSQGTISSLPAEGYVRLPQIIGNPKAVPPIPAAFPVSRSTWLAGVKSGRFPKPVKLGPRTTAWRVEDIRNLIQSAG